MIDDEIEPDFETDADMADFEDSSFEDFETGGGSGGVSDNPLAKVGIVFGVLVVIVVAVVLFGGGKEEIDSSSVGKGSDVSDLPGSGDISPVYRDAIEEHNIEDYETAVRTGESSMPVLTSPARDALDVAPASEAEEDPLERWRRIQEERKVQEAEQAAAIVVPEDTVDYQGEAINNLAELMAEQMGAILDSTEILPLNHVDVATDEFLEEEEEDLQDGDDLSDLQQRAEAIKTLIPAGTIEYGQLITEANSDAQSPILGQIVSGPARGSRLIGSFEVKEEFLVISFNTLVLDGESYPINALALNPETTTSGLVTDIDHRYFRRIILPAAAAFLEGMSEAIVDSQGTTVTNTSGGAAVEEKPELDTKEQLFKGLEEATGVISEILTENSDDVEPLIIVAPGTPLAIVFLDEVTENPEFEEDPVASAGLILPE